MLEIKETKAETSNKFENKRTHSANFMTKIEKLKNLKLNSKV